MSRYRCVDDQKAAGFPVTAACDAAGVSTMGTTACPACTPELRRAGLVVNKKRVERLMRKHGMAGRRHRRRCRTTFPGPDGYQIPDLVGRRFEPGAPDVAWCQDITYIPTGEGWLFLTSVLDLGSRRLLGCSMAEHMRTELVLDASGTAAASAGRPG